MGSLDEGPLADPEYHEPVPLLIPVQERHVVHPPADHDKLAWCREVLDRIDSLIGIQLRIRGMLQYDAHLVNLKLRVRLGDPEHNRHTWGNLERGNKCRYPQTVYSGTWPEAVTLYRDWQDLDDLAAPVSCLILTLQVKRNRYKSIQNELESNIEHWEGV